MCDKRHNKDKIIDLRSEDYGSGLQAYHKGRYDNDSPNET